MPLELWGLCTSSPRFPWAILPPPPCWTPVPWYFLLEGKETSRTTPALGVVWFPPLQPQPSFSHTSPGVFAVSLEICLFLAVISPLPTFSCQALSVPVSTPMVPCSIPVFLGAGGPPSPRAPEVLTSLRLQLVRGYYSLPHLENYSFFRPFRNFNELF